MCWRLWQIMGFVKEIIETSIADIGAAAANSHFVRHLTYSSAAQRRSALPYDTISPPAGSDPTFRQIAGMPELIGFYGTSLLYGTPGIIAGVLYADYQRTKAYFARVSKTSFLARGGIGLSSVYLLGYFGQKIIFENPMVELVLGYIKGGDRAKEIVSQVDYDGALTAGGVIVACAGVLAFNTYREHRRAGRASVPALKEEQETGLSS